MTLDQRPPADPLVIYRRDTQMIVDRATPHNPDFWEAYEWEAGTYAALDYLLDDDTGLVDVGAWIGPFACWAVHICREVLAIEPDPAAFKILKRNARWAPPGLQLAPFAADAIPHRRWLNFVGGNAGSSQSTLIDLNQERPKGVSVQCLPVTTMIKMWQVRHPYVVKIDVEGWEGPILWDLARLWPKMPKAIVVSCHAPFWDAERHNQAMTALGYLLGHGYRYAYLDNGRPVDAARMAATKDLETFILTNERWNA